MNYATIITDILEKTDSVTLNYTAKSYQAVADSLSAEFRVALILYFVVFGILLQQGWITLQMKQIVKHVLIAGFVFMLATNWGYFSIFVYGVFVHGPEQIMSAMVGGNNPMTILQDAYHSGMVAAAAILSNASFGSPGLAIQGVLLGLGITLMVGFALFLMVLSKLGLAILLSIAPIFIPLKLFKKTEGFFQSWISYLFNFALIPTITIALISLILNIMWDSVKAMIAAGENQTWDTVLPFFLVSIIGCFLFSQVKGMASSLGSGAALSTLGAFSSIMRLPGKIGRGVSDIRKDRQNVRNRQNKSSSDSSSNNNPPYGARD